ncbi:Protein tyrosine kinase/Protein kinase domain containing protein, putative [Angomonas deanei]|uniref:non-specific serine/threonine protein kinase n=1 Tax=Angomonas deanei TaxID=59799 RepID=A0A7G2CLF8_9TRYP|nr:Protein tyrosine kinase/Protein kinase domain containing protein, putative [Angomonas deanei]
MSKKERQQSLNEARVLSALKHPNIINYVDSFLAKRSDHLCIVMEFADGGDLCGRIKKNYGVHFRETQVLDWFIQIVMSLNYVHQRKILHRDVKTQNIFLTTDNIIKLGDFGIARALVGTYDQAKTFVGTPYYLSPELILEQPYDHRSDIWAAGVVLYELLALKHPFNANDMKGLMQRILKVQYDPLPMMYSTELRNIVPRLLMKNPAQRLSFADVLELPIVQKRLGEWLRGDVLPAAYLKSLLDHKLLPESALRQHESIGSGQLSMSSSMDHSAVRTTLSEPSLPRLNLENRNNQPASCNTSPRPDFSQYTPPVSVPNSYRSVDDSRSQVQVPRYSRQPMPLSPNPSPQLSSNAPPSGRLGRLDDFYQKLNNYQKPQGRLQPFAGAAAYGNINGRVPKSNPTYAKPPSQIDIRSMLQRAAAERAQRVQRAQYGM